MLFQETLNSRLFTTAFSFLLLMLVYASKPVESLDSLDQCNGVNIFANNESIGFYVRSVRYVQQAIITANLTDMRTPTGLGLSWLRFPLEESLYSIQIRFRDLLWVCCVALTPNVTTVREYDVRLLDRAGGYVTSSQAAGTPTRFVANAPNLFVDMSKSAGSYGIEIIVRRTAVSTEPAYIEVNVVLCERAPVLTTTTEKSKVSTTTTQARVRDSFLLEPCNSNDDCDKYISGNAGCVNNTCQCLTGNQVNMYTCSTPQQEIEDLSFRSKNININFLNKTKNRLATFPELTQIDCIQNADCQSTFLDVNMMCMAQKCICMDGYRLVQDPSSFKVGCLKASSGATIRYPQMCEQPTCEFQLSAFVFNAPASSLQPQRLVSLSLITDNHLYIQEYYQVHVGEDKLKVFIDQQDVMRIILEDRLNAQYRALAQKDGNVVRVPRDVFFTDAAIETDKEPILVRKPRLALIPLYNTSNIVKDNSSDIITVYDTSEYQYLPNYINYGYFDAGNQTVYRIEFNAEMSDFILNTLFKIGASLPSETQLPCLTFRLFRGNFLQLTPISDSPASKITFSFESKHMTRLNGFHFCLNLNPNSPIHSQCKNGLAVYDAKYPTAGSHQQPLRFACHCWTGYWGAQCDVVNPCYTMVTNSTRLGNNNTSNSNEPLPILTKSCANDGVCMPTRAAPMLNLFSKNNYMPYCLCRPQFAGKSCERNLDECVFPFQYGDRKYNKCVLNQTADNMSGMYWCAKSINPADGSATSTATCKSLPCKTPWKYQNSVQYGKYVYKQYIDEKKNLVESPICSFTRNYDLFRTGKLCENDCLS